MTIKTHRTVEHTYGNGDQSVLEVQTIEYDRPIDGSKLSMLISDGDTSVTIHSRAHMIRLIQNLQYIADRELDGRDPLWELEERV